MASVGTVADAFREVLLANKYRQSREHEMFDGSDLHRQFYIQGPRLADTAFPGKYWHDALWEMDAAISFLPRSASDDPDSGRFEVADHVDELLQAWGQDSTINADEFAVTSADPVWNAEGEFWAVLVTLQFKNRRSY